jgi:hypothetical protein
MKLRFRNRIMTNKVQKNIIRHLFYFLFFIPIFSCGSVNKTITFNDSNYEILNKKTRITVRFLDGRAVVFYRMEIVKTDDEYLYAKCWAKKTSQPEEWKFLKNEIVITNEESSGSQTAAYILSLGLMVGLIFLLNKLLYN